MRTIRVLIACLGVLSLLLLPAVAGAETKATPKSAAHAATKAPAMPPSTAIPSAPAASAMPETPATPAAPTAPKTPALPGTIETPAAPAAPAATPPAAPGKEGETAARPNFPYAGYINADLVNVRSGAGLYYYPIGSVSKDTEVTVEGENGNWLALKPGEGVYGLVKRSDLTVGAGAKTATVSAPTARVYAASKSAKRTWCVMNTLKQGDTVQILGEDGDMVRIAPPPDSRVYVVAQYVAAGTSPTLPPAIAQIEIPKADPLIEDYKKADAALTAEQRKEIGTWDFPPIAVQFKDIAAKTDKGYLKKACLDNLALIADLDRRQTEYLKVMAIPQNLNQRLAELKSDAATKQATADMEHRAAKPEFTAVGMVARMESLENVDYPIKFKLVDQSGRPLVVLKSSAYDLNKFVGKVVGVRGQKTYLKDWRIYVVGVDELEVQE